MSVIVSKNGCECCGRDAYLSKALGNIPVCQGCKHATGDCRCLPNVRCPAVNSGFQCSKREGHKDGHMSKDGRFKFGWA